MVYVSPTKCHINKIPINFIKNNIFSGKQKILPLPKQQIHDTRNGHVKECIAFQCFEKGIEL